MPPSNATSRIAAVYHGCRVGQSRRGARYSAGGHLPSRCAAYADPQRAHGGTGRFHCDMGSHGWIMSFTVALVSYGSSAHRPSITGPLPLTELRPSASAVTWGVPWSGLPAAGPRRSAWELD